MKNLIKLSVFLLLFFYSSQIISIENKIVFIVDGEIYTSIDISERKKYLQTLRQKLDVGSINSIKKDLFSAVLFHKEFIERNKDIKNQSIEIYGEIKKNYGMLDTENEINKIFRSIEKKIYIKNIIFDLNRKKIIEKKLNIKSNKVVNPDNNDIIMFDVIIEYFLFNKKNEEKILENLNSIDLSNIDETKKNLDLKAIQYLYQYKKVKNYNSLNYKFKKLIEKNISYFKINISDNLLIGRIIKTYKNENKIDVELYKITSNQKIEKELIYCKNLEELNKGDGNVTKYNNIKYSELNLNLQKKLLKKNDFAEIIANNEFVYILACKINFDEELYKKTYLDEMINYNAKIIEQEFINIISKKYTIINNE